MFFNLILGLVLSPIVIAHDSKKPLLQELAIPRNLSENQTLRILCALVQGESVRLVWFLNDRKLTENSRIKIKQIDDSSELTIRSLSVDDLGEIKCRAKNENGEDNQRVEVKIHTKPKFTKKPEDVITTLNKGIGIDCEAKAYPPPSVRWVKLNDETKQNVVQHFESNKLNFELTKQTSGIYRCVARNTMGQIESTIKVIYYGE